MLYSVTLYYNIGRGEGEEKACFRDLGVVSVIEFKIRVCLNRFCPRLLVEYPFVYVYYQNLIGRPICPFSEWKEAWSQFCFSQKLVTSLVNVYINALLNSFRTEFLGLGELSKIEFRGTGLFYFIFYFLQQGRNLKLFQRIREHKPPLNPSHPKEELNL